MRTCIATRTQHHDSHLLRLVADGGKPAAILPDPHRRFPGRGCWITPSIEAVDIAEQRHAFSRALRISAPVDTRCIRQYLEAIIKRTT